MFIIAGLGKEPLFRCRNRTCRKKSSIRTGTIFSSTTCSLQKIILVLIVWILKYPKSTLIKETELNENTIQKLLDRFRELLTIWLIENSSEIGGDNSIVEIDESAFGKRKYNRGRITKTKWVVGGIDRISKKCFLKLVSQRNESTLRNIILENVQPGTTIITDSWRGYNTCNLESNGFKHFKVNHSKTFVNPTNMNINTQRIESH